MKYGLADISTLSAKSLADSAAIGYSVKSAPIRFFFDGDKAPHFRCPPGTRRSGKWTDRLGTDCELGGARVALARIGERMQNIAQGEGGRGGKNPDLPSLRQRAQVRFGVGLGVGEGGGKKKPGFATALDRAADVVDPGGKKKRRVGVATRMSDLADVVDPGGKGKKRGFATALDDAADVVDPGGKGKKRGIATALDDMADIVDRGKSKTPVSRSTGGKMPEPTKVPLDKPKTPKTVKPSVGAVTAIEDVAATRAVRPKRVRAVTKYPTDVTAAAREQLDRMQPEDLKTPEEINAVLTDIHKNRARMVKARDRIDGLVERKKVDPKHKDMAGMQSEARRLDNEIAKADRQIEDLRDRRRALKKAAPAKAEKPVKKVVKKAPAKKAVKKPAKKPVKKVPAKKAVKKTTALDSNAEEIGKNAEKMKKIEDEIWMNQKRIDGHKRKAEALLEQLRQGLEGEQLAEARKALDQHNRAMVAGEAENRRLKKQAAEVFNGIESKTPVKKIVKKPAVPKASTLGLPENEVRAAWDAEYAQRVDILDLNREVDAAFDALDEAQKRLEKHHLDWMLNPNASTAKKEKFLFDKEALVRQYYDAFARQQAVVNRRRDVELQERLDFLDGLGLSDFFMQLNLEDDIENIEQAIEADEAKLKEEREIIKALRDIGRLDPKNFDPDGAPLLLDGQSLKDYKKRIALYENVNFYEKAIARNRKLIERMQEALDGAKPASASREKRPTPPISPKWPTFVDPGKTPVPSDMINGSKPTPAKPYVASGAKRRAVEKIVNERKGQKVLRERAVIKDVQLRKERPEGFGLAGEVGEDGLVHIKGVPVGANGITNPDVARQHLLDGGNVSDIPDAFIRDVFLVEGTFAGTSSTSRPFTTGEARRSSISTMVLHPDLKGRWAAVKPEGRIGDNMLLIDLSDPAHPRGFFLKGDVPDAMVHELMGHQVAHAMGVPIIPGRFDGLGKNNGDAGGITRFVLLEHAMNAVEDGVAGKKWKLDEARQDPEHLFGFEARIQHFLTNFFMQVSDRHEGNGILGRDKDGNWVAVPIDLAWAGRSSAPRIEGYANMFRRMDSDMAEGRVKALIDTLPEDLRADALERVRTTIKLSRERLVQYVADEEKHTEDMLKNLAATGAGPDEIEKSQKALEKRFADIRDILSKNSSRTMLNHFGVL